MDERVKNSSVHYCASSGCCDFSPRDPTRTALDAMDTGLRSYEWLRDEGEHIARQATAKAGAMIVLVAALVTALFVWLTR